MGRPSYVCTTCSEHFTRKYSARRHNHNLHNGAAEIVRLIDYLAGRSSGQYLPNSPFWFKRSYPNHNIGSRTVADSTVFEAGYLHQQVPLGRSQYPLAHYIGFHLQIRIEVMEQIYPRKPNKKLMSLQD
jgi:hypothetical protein